MNGRQKLSDYGRMMMSMMMEMSARAWAAAEQPA